MESKHSFSKRVSDPPLNNISKSEEIKQTKESSKKEHSHSKDKISVKPISNIPNDIKLRFKNWNNKQQVQVEEVKRKVQDYGNIGQANGNRLGELINRRRSQAAPQQIQI